MLSSCLATCAVAVRLFFITVSKVLSHIPLCKHRLLFMATVGHTGYKYSRVLSGELQNSVVPVGHVSHTPSNMISELGDAHIGSTALCCTVSPLYKKHSVRSIKRCLLPMVAAGLLCMSLLHGMRLYSAESALCLLLNC